MKRKKPKMMKEAMGLTTLGITSGIGLGLIQSAGGNTSGLATLTSAAKPVGSIIGAGMVLDSLQHLKNSARPPKRKFKL